TQGVLPQPGQPPPYLARTAASRSMPVTLASVTSQASVSANSSCSSSREPCRSAADNSPTSSMNHMKVPSTPRRLSLAPYMSRITRCSCARVNEGIPPSLPSLSRKRLMIQHLPQPLHLGLLLLLRQRLEQHVAGLVGADVDLQTLPRVLFRLGRLARFQ